MVDENEKSEVNHIQTDDQGNSNLATPTFFFFEKDTEKPIFSLSQMSVADNSGRLKRKPKVNSLGLKYREARLVHHNYHPTKKWFIVFYAFDITKNKLVRKRVGKSELNSIKDLDERKAEAFAQLRSINEELKKGWLESKREKEEIRAYDFHGYKFLNALEFVIRYKQEIEKKRKNTIQQYNYALHTVQDFMHDKQISNAMPLRMLNKGFVDKFTEYMIKEKELSNKTHNGIITTLHSMIEKLRSLDDHLFKDKNPVRVVKLKVVSNTHAAYSMDQLQKFTAAIEKTDPQLLLFIRFIYFTLGRPKEMARIKVGDIFLDLKQIKITGIHSKNSKEKYVGISQAFNKIILESGILSYPASHYVFGAGGKPSQKHVGENYFYKRFRPFMDQLKFKELNSRYTMYSFKHSGAIQLYMNTKDLELVRKQCRHETLSQTSTYLQELGTFTNFDALAEWKGF